MRVLAAGLVMCCLLALPSCGGSSNNPSSSAATLSGNWQMTLQSSTLSASELQSGFLVQSGNVISGSLLFSGQTISGETACAGVGSALGQTSGSSLAVVVTTAGQTINLTATSANNLTSMTGSYSVLASGCGQTEVGTFSANQVNPLTGSFQAVFNSNVSGEISNFTGSIKQGVNTGGSTAVLSGSMTSTDATCFTSATVAGVVSGTAVVLNLLTSDGVALGKFQGTMATDATSITGAYTFSNASNSTVLTGCGGRDTGTASFTVAAQSSSTL